jgi:hypothetical protein
MERRNFLRTLVGGVAVAAAVRTWPFRVYSFPSEPVTAIPDDNVFFDNQIYYLHPFQAESLKIKKAWEHREFYPGQQYLIWNGQSWDAN